MPEVRIPFFVECLNCEAISIAAYLPMEVHTFAQICGAHRCPYCGARPDRHTVSAGPARPPKQDGE